MPQVPKGISEVGVEDRPVGVALGVGRNAHIPSPRVELQGFVAAVLPDPYVAEIVEHQGHAWGGPGPRRSVQILKGGLEVEQRFLVFAGVLEGVPQGVAESGRAGVLRSVDARHQTETLLQRIRWRPRGDAAPCADTPA